MKTKQLVLCAVCAAVTCVLAPISIPLTGLVPISLATFAVLFSGILLGGRLGAVSQGIYLLLGAAGIPVFAGYTAGAARLLGPTGGFLIGYIPMAFIAGSIYSALGRMRKPCAAKYLSMLLAMIAGEIALYIFGVLWYCVYTGALYPAGIAAALTVCVLPFLPGDAAKLAAVAAITPALELALSRIGSHPRKNQNLPAD